MTQLQNLRPRQRVNVPVGFDMKTVAPFLVDRIEQVAIGDLQSYHRSLRKHDQRQISKLSAGMSRFGFVVPMLIDKTNTVIAGHGRLEAAKALGLTNVPAIRIDHLSAAEVNALRIADNRLGELSEWDETNLALELKELTVDLSLELLDVTGFETCEIDSRIELLDTTSPDALDDAPEPAKTAVSVLGDLFILGTHRLFCGTSLEEASYQILLQGEKARIGFSDPPYNVKINGHVSGLGKAKHAEFAMGAGEMDEREFIGFLTPYLALTRQHSVDGAIHYACMDGAHTYELLTAARAAGLHLKATCTWAKTNAGMGSFYRHQTEFVHVFKNGGDSVPHVNNIQLGKHGRYRTTLWTYAGANTFRRGRMKDLSDHPTVKPRALVADAILDCSRRGDIVLDAFCGSGTTIIAAETTDRRACAIELDPIYIDVAVLRWQTLTGQKAIHAATGLTFEALAAERNASNGALASSEVSHG